MLEYTSPKGQRRDPLDFDFGSLRRAGNALLGKNKTDELLKDRENKKNFLVLIGGLLDAYETASRKGVDTNPNQLTTAEKEVGDLKNLGKAQTYAEELPIRIRGRNQFQSVFTNGIQKIGKENEYSLRIGLQSLASVVENAETTGSTKMTVELDSETLKGLQEDLTQAVANPNSARIPKARLVFQDELNERPEIKRIWAGNPLGKAKSLSKRSGTPVRDLLSSFTNKFSGSTVPLSKNCEISSITIGEKTPNGNVMVTLSIELPEIKAAISRAGGSDETQVPGRGMLTDEILKTHCARNYGCNGRDFVKASSKIARSLAQDLERASSTWLDTKVVTQSLIEKFLEEYELLSITLKRRPTPKKFLEPIKSRISSETELVSQTSPESPEHIYGKEIVGTPSPKDPMTCAGAAGEEFMNSLVDAEIERRTAPPEEKRYKAGLEETLEISDVETKQALIEANYLGTDFNGIRPLDGSPKEIKLKTYAITPELIERYQDENEIRNQEIFDSKSDKDLSGGSLEPLSLGNWIQEKTPPIELKLPSSGSVLRRLTRYLPLQRRGKFSPNSSGKTQSSVVATPQFISATKAEKFDTDWSMPNRGILNSTNMKLHRTLSLEDLMTKELSKQLSEIRKLDRIGGANKDEEKLNKRIDRIVDTLKHWQSSLRPISPYSRNPYEARVASWLESISQGLEQKEAGTPVEGFETLQINSIEELEHIFCPTSLSLGRSLGEKPLSSLGLPVRSSSIPLQILCNAIGSNPIEEIEVMKVIKELYGTNGDGDRNGNVNVTQNSISTENGFAIIELKAGKSIRINTRTNSFELTTQENGSEKTIAGKGPIEALICLSGLNPREAQGWLENRFEAHNELQDLLDDHPALWDMTVRWQCAENVAEQPHPEVETKLIESLESAIKSEAEGALLLHAISMEIAKKPDYLSQYLDSIGLPNGLYSLDKAAQDFGDLILPLHTSPQTMTINGEEILVSEVLSRLEGAGHKIELDPKSLAEAKEAPEEVLNTWLKRCEESLEKLRDLGNPTNQDASLTLILEKSQPNEYEEIDPFDAAIATLHETMPQSKVEMGLICETLKTHNPKRLTITTLSGALELTRGSGGKWIPADKSPEGPAAAERINSVEELMNSNPNELSQEDREAIEQAETKAYKNCIMLRISEVKTSIQHLPPHLANIAKIKEDIIEPLIIQAESLERAKKAQSLARELLSEWRRTDSEETKSTWGWNQEYDLSPRVAIDFICDKITGGPKGSNPEDIQEKYRHYVLELISSSDKEKAAEILASTGRAEAAEFILETINRKMNMVKEEATAILPKQIQRLEETIDEISQRARGPEGQELLKEGSPVGQIIKDKQYYRSLEKLINKKLKDLGTSKAKGKETLKAVGFDPRGPKEDVRLFLEKGSVNILTNKAWVAGWLKTDAAKTSIKERLNIANWVKASNLEPKTAMAFLEFCHHRNLGHIPRKIVQATLSKEDNAAISDAMRKFEKSLKSLGLDSEKTSYRTQLYASYALSQYANARYNKSSPWKKDWEIPLQEMDADYKNVEPASFNISGNLPSEDKLFGVSKEEYLNKRLQKRQKGTNELKLEATENYFATRIRSPFLEDYELNHSGSEGVDLNTSTEKTKIKGALKAVGALYRVINI